jgi:hypothetical protein
MNTWREHVKSTSSDGAWTWKGQVSDWPYHALVIHLWPDLEQYFSLVGGYNSHSLTFESDALRAFTTIIKVCNRTFRNGFLFGIPEFLFDVGLLWSAPNGLKRRKDFPSWSWSGDIKFLEMANA